VTFLEAAIEVLWTARRPLRIEEITEIALRRGLIQPKGKTPRATMSAALYAAPPDAAVRREFIAGRQRAQRGSVRWKYAPKKR
jgi:hypothetical protein